MSNIKEIFVKTEQCTGCQSCKLACAVAHSQSKNLFAAINETVKAKSRLYVEWLPGNIKIPILCRHCEDAPCVKACISGAITRTDDGLVITAADKCIGCWTCVMVCPYGVIGRDADHGKAYRCDRCQNNQNQDNQNQGRQIPACVSACPTGALVYETVEGFSKNTRKYVSEELVS
jgi:anaerobic carbon-monoxide dehydrogenase iron sulfur subunit